MDSTLEANDDTVANKAVKPLLKPLEHDLLFPNGTEAPPAWETLREHLKAEGKVTKEDAITIIRRARDVHHDEPNVVRLDYPVHVIGDIHGQYYDLLTILSHVGSPANTHFLFLGDYVDRGSFSVEVMLLLYAIKLNFPQNVYLLRGNHECRQLTSHFNFLRECEHKYDVELYEEFVASFDDLPLCGIIDDKFFALHGGISPHMRTISDIEALNRFQEPPSQGLMCDLLWSDPYSEFGERGLFKSNEETLLRSFESSVKETQSSKSSNKFSCLPLPKRRPHSSQPHKDINHYLPNDLRGCSYTFGAEAIREFLEANNLLCIIRAHEAQLEGYKMQYNNPDTGFPGVITVFSAPNYCDVHKNKGAILYLSKGSLRVQQFTWSQHPYYLPYFMDVFTWSIPFVSEKVLEMLNALMADEPNDSLDDAELPPSVIEFMWGNGDEDDNNTEKAKETPSWLLTRGNAIKNKVKSIGRILKLYHELKQQNEAMRKIQMFSELKDTSKGVNLQNDEAAKQVDSFRHAQSVDIINERRPGLE